MEDEPDHPILSRPWTYHLERIDWRPSPTIAETWIDLTFCKGDERRRLRFIAPTAVEIEKDFRGQCSGLAIRDIRSRGWDGIRIEVVNFEQDPGITFFAADVVDLDDAEAAERRAHDSSS
jgi:hypothetical protein